MVKVRDIMTKSVITIAWNRSAEDARVLMRRHQVHHLPVIDHHTQIVGIVSEKDFTKSREQDSFTADNAPLSAIMSKDVITCTPSCRVTSVAATMITCKIACIPVVAMQSLVGIVTTSDLLDLLCRFDELDGHQVMPLNFRNRDAFFL
jgi:CBS domain-containing protein